MNTEDQAHEYAKILLNHIMSEHGKLSEDNALNIAKSAWYLVDLMKAESEKREKEDAAKKRAEIKEILNSNSTFVEREGQHFDDVEWQPDWSQAPNNATHWTMKKDGSCLWWKGKPLFDGSCFFDVVGISHTVGKSPSFGYKGDWRDSLRMRPEGV